MIECIGSARGFIAVLHENQTNADSRAAPAAENAGRVGKTKQQLRLLTWTELTGGLVPTSIARRAATVKTITLMIP